MKQGLLFFATVMLLCSFSVIAEPTITNEPDQIAGVYQIATWEDLLWISQNPEYWDKDFVQINDIDFGDAVPAITTWNEGKGWSPIGIIGHDDTQSEVEYPFTGSYDGGGYSIENLYINRTSEYGIGLFCVVRDANIENISLVEATISGGALVGGIVGIAEGHQISNCFVSGSIQGYMAVGGIAGLLMAGEINESHNTANIAVIGGEAMFAGGVVGLISDGHIINTYNSGDIAGMFILGGLVGFVAEGEEGESEPDPRITNSYSTGALHVTEDEAPVPTKINKLSHPIISGFDLSEQPTEVNFGVGGAIGLDVIGITITNTFWDVDKDGLEGTASGDDNFGAIGKTTEEMMTPNTFSESFWAITEDNTIAKGYPFLAWEPGQRAEKNQHVWIIGTGTGSDPDPGDPVAVPLSNTALYLGFLLIGGLMFFRTYRMS